MRPKKYYTIPRESLESVLGDVEQLINFFMMELQRLLFAENVWATIAVRLISSLSLSKRVSDREYRLSQRRSYRTS